MKRKLPPIQCTDNGTKTVFYKNDEGKVYVRLSVFNQNFNGDEFHFPADLALYVIPLYSFYDWHYNAKNKDIELAKVRGTNPPKEAVKVIGQGMKITDCFDEDFKGINNKIYKDNIEALMTLKLWGFTTMLDNFSEEDIKENYKLRNKLIESVKVSALERQGFLKEDTDEIAVTRKGHMHKSLENLNDNEQRVLIIMGLCSAMTRIMQKTLEAK